MVPTPLRRAGRTPLAASAAAVATAAALALGGLAACGSDSGGDGGDGRIRVVAGFYPLQFVSEQVGGDAVRVTNLARPGIEPHDLELSPRQVAQVADADLVVYLKGFQPALDDAVRQEAADRAFDLASVSPQADFGPNHAEVADDPDGHHGSDGQNRDPHVWLDPTRLGSIGARLAERLGELDPRRAADFRIRALQLDVRLQQLDHEYADGLATCQRREIVTSHAAFGYLADRYQLRQVAITGLAPDAEPSPRRLAEAAEQARRHRATTIFFESSASPRISEAVAREIGAKTAVLDPIERIEPGGGDDYLSVMRRNLTTLRTALGCS